MRPTCPKCDSTSFSMEEMAPIKSAYKFMGVCCTKCGAVVGVQEYYNVGTLIHKLAKALKINLDSY